MFSYDGGLLLVQRAIHPSYGKWVFPGGYVDRGEALEAAAIREVKEESGLDVRLTRLLGVYSSPGYPVILIADPWGAELFRMMGYKSPDEFLAVLKVK